MRTADEAGTEAGDIVGSRLDSDARRERSLVRSVDPPLRLFLGLDILDRVLHLLAAHLQGLGGRLVRTRVLACPWATLATRLLALRSPLRKGMTKT